MTKLLPGMFVVLTSMSLRAQEFECAGYEPATASIMEAAKPVSSVRKPEARGRQHALVVFAKFKEEAPRITTAPDFAEALFDEEHEGSLAHFFSTMSAGQFELTATIMPKRYESERRADFYVAKVAGEIGMFSRFASEVLRAADADVDFTQFDNDGPDGIPNSGDDDGSVDYVFINVLSAPRGFIMGGATGVAGLRFDESFASRDIGANGEAIEVSPLVRAGSLSREGGFSQTAGTMAHEYGHALGLPDLYDIKYSGPEDDSAGIGKWGLMGWGAHGWNGDDGPNPFSAWSLKKLGWIGEANSRLERIEGDVVNLLVEDVFSGGVVYQVALPAPLDTIRYNIDPDKREHLLIEKRSSRRFYGRNDPSHGVLVWHVEGGPTNYDERRKLVDLVSADGLYADSGYPAGERDDGRFGSDNLDFWSHELSYSDRHGGNRGDATDPFDGITYQHLSHSTNPSTAPGNRVPAASSGVSIRIHRESDGMRLDVRQPRWAGVIEAPVQWSGQVFIDGDLTVSPSGGLHLHHDTSVFFDDEDRNNSGLDPALCELHIEGDLKLDPKREPITFTALRPAGQWYGIVLEPEAGSKIQLPQGGFLVEDSREGVIVVSAPPGSGDKLDLEYLLMDEWSLLTTGNGDGAPAPGEVFQLLLTATNWSPFTLETASVAMRPLSPLVTFRDEALNTSRRDPHIGRIPLYPGVGQSITSPVMRVAEAAKPGDTLAFRITYNGSETLSDTVTFAIRGDYPQYLAQLTIEGANEERNSVRLNADVPWVIRTSTAGEIDQAEVIISELVTEEPIKVVPLVTQEETAGGVDFTGKLQLPGPGLYSAQLRLGSSSRGLQVLTDTTLMIWAHPPEERLSSLAFLDLSSDGQLDQASEVLGRILEPHDRAVQIINPMPTQSEVYEAMLPHVTGQDALVIWGGGPSRFSVAADGLHAFLRGGGRLLVSISDPSKLDDESRELFFIEDVQPRRRLELRSLFLPDSPGLTGRYRPLSIRSPAKPMFIADQSLTGVFVDNVYRTAVLPIEFRQMIEEPYDLFLGSAIKLLLEDQYLAQLRAPGQETGSAFLASPVEEPATVEAVVKGDRGRAELNVLGLTEKADATMIEMERVGFDGESTTFITKFGPSENEKYMLTLNLYDEQGEWIPNSAQMGIIGYRSSADVLVLLQSQDETPDVLPVFDRALMSSGKEAAFLAEEELGEFTEALILSYAKEEKTIYSFAGISTEDRRQIVRRLTEQGGRFVLFNATVLSRNGGYALDVLKASDPTSSASRAVSSANLVPGDPIEFEARQFVTLLPPAIPLLEDDRGRATGWYLPQDAGAFAVIGVNYKRIDEAILEKLVWLAADISERADDITDLDIPGKKKIGNTYLVAAGGQLPVRALAADGVDSVELVSWLTGEATKRSAAMTRAEDGSFQTSISIDTDGTHMAAARVVTADGERYLSGGSIHIMAGIPQTSMPALVVIHDGSSRNRKFREEIEDLLAELKISATVVTQRTDLAVVDHLLDSVADGGLVMWFSDQVREGEVAALRSFVERGGRLLLSSGEVDDGLVSVAFLTDILGIGVLESKSFNQFMLGNEESPLRIHHRDLVLTPPARPLLRSHDGLIASSRVATDGYRAVFQGFDMWDAGIGSSKVAARKGRETILKEALGFLTAEDIPDISLRITSVVAPHNVVRAGPLRPTIVVANEDDFPSEPFLVAYRATVGDSVVAEFETLEASLAASSERQIALPEWTGSAEDVSIEVGIGPQEGGLDFGEPFLVSLIDVRAGMTQTELPVEAISANGAAFFDYDRDGDEDLYIVRTAGPNRLLRNDNGTFADAGAEVGLADSSMGRGVAIGDYDGDGYPDLYLTNSGAPNRLMHNDGGERFRDVTALMSGHVPTLADSGLGRSAGFFDADNDGDLDLYFANARTARVNLPNRFFINDGTVFRDASVASGLLDDSSSKGLAFADVDGDADVDLFIASTEDSRFYRNTDSGFVDDTDDSGLPTASGAVGCVFGDYDNDGDVDLFVSNESGFNQLFANQGDGRFREIPRDAQYFGEGSVGAALFDYDNDGDLDLATTAVSGMWGGDELMLNRSSRFVPIGALLDMEEKGSGRGLAVSDYDGDGDVDLLVALTHGPRLYESHVQTDEGDGGFGWLGVSLRGKPPNSDGIGAVVELFANETGAQRRDIFGPNGYASHGSVRAHFGIGGSPVVDSLRVLWPDGAVTVLTGLLKKGLNRHHEIEHPLLARTGYVAASGRPIEFRLDHGYPNPFNAAVSIPFAIPADSPVKLEIFNVAGQRVRILLDETLMAGVYRPRWDGLDDEGHSLASGVYIYRLRAGDFEHSRRLMLLQ